MAVSSFAGEVGAIPKAKSVADVRYKLEHDLFGDVMSFAKVRMEATPHELLGRFRAYAFPRPGLVSPDKSGPRFAADCSFANSRSVSRQTIIFPELATPGC